MSEAKHHYEGNGWSEYEKLVIYRLDDLKCRLEKVESNVTALQIKAAAWGGLAGGAVWGVSFAISNFLNK